MRIRKAISACAVAVAVIAGSHIDSASAATVNTNSSIVDYMVSIGQDPSFANRKKIALKYNIVPYSGTAEQNIKLLDLLKGTSAKPEQTAKSTQTSTEAPNLKTITVTATAYTADCQGCSGVTATGIDLKANPNQKVIAVDPSVIPLGSKVYVSGYGEAIAADTGGAIKGPNRIDVFIPDKQEALNWGVRTVKLTILK